MATIKTINSSQKQAKTLRVAAYCRVSSSSEDQFHSFASQVQYYTTIIGENPKLELADIYVDEGLTAVYPPIEKIIFFCGHVYKLTTVYCCVCKGKHNEQYG